MAEEERMASMSDEPLFNPSRVTLGTWPMGGDGRYGTTNDDMAIHTIQRAFELGVTSFDTAPGYGSGHAEELLGEALEGMRSSVLLTSKFGAGRPGKRNSSRDGILRELDGTLRRLRTDYVDAYLIHWPDERTPLEVTMETLDELVEDGRIRFAGVSNFDVDLIRRCQDVRPVDVVQVGYNLFDQRMDAEVLPYCHRHGIVAMGYGSLAHGLLAGAFSARLTLPERDWRSRGILFGQPLLRGDRLRRNVEVVERLRTHVAEAKGLSIAQLALSWVLSNPRVATALVGARTPAEIEEDLLSAALSSEDRQKIDEIMSDAVGQVDVFRPYAWAMEDWGPAAASRPVESGSAGR